ncbi:MAG: Holliday junction resolvase [Gammaproteobacteria bacterium]|nr:Holliday junction resolvase [Gammaproteobacteria bacterium]
MKIKTLLCFDFGEKRIGVAVGQTITGTATPLETISVHQNKPDWGKIKHLIDDWQPDALIVGTPLNMDGTTQRVTQIAEKFARQLEGRFHLPVFGMDERLSTYEASQRTNNSTALDPVAAQVILESWLAENSDKISSVSNGINKESTR